MGAGGMQPWEVGILTQLEIQYNNSDLPGAKKEEGGSKTLKERCPWKKKGQIIFLVSYSQGWGEMGKEQELGGYWAQAIFTQNVECISMYMFPLLLSLFGAYPSYLNKFSLSINLHLTHCYF